MGILGTMSLPPTLVLDRASPDDIEELLKLYFTVYGSKYPLSFGTDPKVMRETILSQNHIWLVSRNQTNREISGSCVFALDRFNKIAKGEGLVVHPRYRNRHLSSEIVMSGVDTLLNGSEPINSIYVTTRTLSIGPQLIFLHNGFLPLGIFPNSHRLDEYETLTLFAKYRPGVLSRRETPPAIPEKMKRIMEISESIVNIKRAPAAIVPSKKLPAPSSIRELHFETIFAPSYVKKRFLEKFPDPYDRFYPFHTPNLLLASTNGEVEVYAYLNSADEYCTIVSTSKPIYWLGSRMRLVIEAIRAAGATYIEILMGVEHTTSLETLLDMQFLPSAIYPAMQEREGKLYDFVLMSRTMEPLNFRGMAIASPFKPYVDQYLDLWKKMHLDTLEVFNDYN